MTLSYQPVYSDIPEAIPSITANSLNPSVNINLNLSAGMGWGVRYWVTVAIFASPHSLLG